MLLTRARVLDGTLRIRFQFWYPGSSTRQTQIRCRNGAANQVEADLVRKVAGLVSLSLPRTTCAIVGGGGLPREPFLNQLQRKGQ